MTTAKETPRPRYCWTPDPHNKENVEGESKSPPCQPRNDATKVMGVAMTPGAYSKLTLNKVLYNNLPDKHKFCISSSDGFNTTHKKTSTALAHWNNTWQKAPKNRSKQLCNIVREGTSFLINAKKLSSHVRNGNAGKTPQFKKKTADQAHNDQLDKFRKQLKPALDSLKSPEVLKRKCQGIQPQKQKDILYLIGRSRREGATEIEELTEETYSFKLKGFQRFGNHNDFANYCQTSRIHPKFELLYEWDKAVFRANDCVGEFAAKSPLATQCANCKAVRDDVHNWVARAKPLGRDGEQLISAKTNHRYLASHPITLKAAVGQWSEERRAMKKEISKLRFQKHILPEMVTVDPNSAEGAAIPRVFKAAQAQFNKDHKDDENMVFMWELMMEHLKKVDGRKGKMVGIRFHPQILNFALMLLAKTSHSVYQDVQEVLKLPSLSYILRKKKKRESWKAKSRDQHSWVGGRECSSAEEVLRRLRHRRT